MTISAHVVSKDALITYIKERLGYPVIQVEITDQQIEHIINETIEKFIEFAEGGVQTRFTTLNVIADTQTYSMDFDVYAIINMFDQADLVLGTTIFEDKNLTPEIDQNLFFQGLHKQDLLTIELSRNMLESINFMLRVKVLYDYNTATRQLYLIESPEQGFVAGVLYYQRPDYSDGNSLIYDNHWVKRYTTALSRKQWGNNLTKYSGSTLPAGLQMNAESILQEANTEIEKLDEELQTTWRLPNDFQIG
jgi:hypothetical protein